MTQIITGVGINLNSAATNPVSSGLVADFDFSKWQNMVISGGKIAQITDSISSIVSSQVTPSLQPTFNKNGGPGNNSYASFNATSLLSGALITSSTDFTFFVIYREPNGIASRGSSYQLFQNGQGSTGYGYYAYGYSGGDLSGVIYPGVAYLGAVNSLTIPNVWTVACASHSSNLTKQYNITNDIIIPANNTTYNPITPVSGHSIGQGVFDISRILIYNRQLLDSEVASVNNFLQSRYTNHGLTRYIAGGDSISADVPTPYAVYPRVTTYDLVTSYPMFNIDTGVDGRKSAEVLSNLTSEVLSKFVPGYKNIYSLLIGTNDIAASVSVSTIYSNITSVISQVKATGFKTIVGTVLYRSDISVNSTIDSLNALIKANTAGADLVVDFNANANLQNPNDTTWFIDKLHPTIAGQQAMATQLEPIISTL